MKWSAGSETEIFVTIESNTLKNLFSFFKSTRANEKAELGSFNECCGNHISNVYRGIQYKGSPPFSSFNLFRKIQDNLKNVPTSKNGARTEKKFSLHELPHISYS